METKKRSRAIEPSSIGPFYLAIFLTFFTILAAWLGTGTAPTGSINYLGEVLFFWYDGFWELLAFSMQMMLILVLGYVIALTPLIRKLISNVLLISKNTFSAVFFVAFFTLLIAYINWGMGLIFGAIMAKKMGEYAAEKNIKVNYPLLGAAGYSGLMVWHGGLSGSAPLSVAEEGHPFMEQMGVLPINETIFSSMNIFVMIAMLAAIPLVLGVASRYAPASETDTGKSNNPSEEIERIPGKPGWLMQIFGGIIILLGVLLTFKYGAMEVMGLNYINFFLLGISLILMGNVHRFLAAVDISIKAASGILIQFPLYAGIMGVMKYSGLLGVISDFFVSISGPATFPILTFFSAGIVNFFVPSGGGQWAVQGPLIIDAAGNLGMDMGKSVMALAYGDGLTNMIQPFWALPLLGITGISARKLLPYTLIVMGVGVLIYLSALLIF